MMDLQELWSKALAALESEVASVSFKTWFGESYILKEENGVLFICTPNIFVRDWIASKYSGHIARVIRDLCPDIRSIEYVVRKRKPKNNYYSMSSNNELPISNSFVNRNSNLNPRYTFDNYIVGKFNELAEAMARAIVMNPGVYNPFFIYGQTGLGKTHLIQAVGNQMLEDNPDMRVIYVTSDKFSKDIVSAVRTGSIEALKERYKKYDLLILDDVQFIASKERAQEELFVLFNALYDAGKQIVFSSDRHPNFMNGLESRLRSRFVSGHIAEILLPDYESRLAIINQKIINLGLDNSVFTDEIVDYIARNIDGNIRELEGVVNSLSIKVQIDNKLTLESVYSVIKNSIKPRKNVSVADVVRVVCGFFGVEMNLIYSKRRQKKIVFVRQVIMYILRDMYGMSFPHIGNELGGRDHTTVMYSYQKVSDELSKNSELMSQITQLKSMLATN